MLRMAVQTAPVDLFVLIAYPAVFQLHAAGWGHAKDSQGMVLPPTVPASTAYLEAHGAYLVDAGHVCILWLGANATPVLVAVRIT
jgi:Gelsolin repeat